MNRMTDLERDIEESRARLDRTIDQLQDRMTYSGVADDVIGTARRYGYGPQIERAAEAIRENPIPVLLVAAGIGWLALSMTSTARRREARRDLQRRGVWDRPPRRHVAGDTSGEPGLDDGDRRREARRDLERRGVWDRPARRPLSGDRLRDEDIDPAMARRPTETDMVRREGPTPHGRPDPTPTVPERPAAYEPVTTERPHATGTPPTGARR
ncbi:DUF3618 domain-containing protein [Salinarimonas sp.]|uniref:DUF3618 domain-containing protein n=1 Tax=Salinarimonas sp. TaxID=2766526 RepID=UPI0032D96592